jgi:hypothetical protein
MTAREAGTGRGRHKAWTPALPLSLSVSLSLSLSVSLSLSLSLSVCVCVCVCLSLSSSLLHVYVCTIFIVIANGCATTIMQIISMMALLLVLYVICISKRIVLPDMQTSAIPQAHIPTGHQVHSPHSIKCWKYLEDPAHTFSIFCDAGYAAAAGDPRCSPCFGYYQFSTAGAATCSECEFRETDIHVLHHANCMSVYSSK